MDRHTKEQRRKNMQAVKNKGSEIESLLSKNLWKAGFRYRKNYTKVFGKPDFVMPKYKIVVFCDSEFWHGKDWAKARHEIKSNKYFWYKKISANIERDKLVNKTLKEEGWTVFRFWGKDIKKDPSVCVNMILQHVNNEK